MSNINVVVQGEETLLVTPEQLLNAVPRIRQLNPNGIEFQYVAVSETQPLRTLLVKGKVLDPRELEGVIMNADRLVRGETAFPTGEENNA